MAIGAVRRAKVQLFRSGEAVDAVRGVHRRESRQAHRRELPRHGQRGGAHLTFWTPCMQHATTVSREYFGASWAGPPLSRAQQGAHAETEGTTSGLGWIHVRDSRAIGEYLGASSAKKSSPVQSSPVKSSQVGTLERVRPRSPVQSSPVQSSPVKSVPWSEFGGRQLITAGSFDNLCLRLTWRLSLERLHGRSKRTKGLCAAQAGEGWKGAYRERSDEWQGSGVPA
jgi:hypothetical protein